MLVDNFTASLTLVSGEFVIILVKYAYFHEFHKLILALVFTRSMAGSSTRSGGGGICPKCPILDPPLDTTRGHHRKLFKFRSRLLLRHNFFTNRVVNLWNSLPADVISAPTVALFKKNLDDLWRTTRYGHSQRPAA